MQIAFQLISRLVSELSIRLHKDLLASDRHTDTCKPLLSLDLLYLFSEVNAFIWEVKNVWHHFNKLRQLHLWTASLIRMLNDAIDQVFVDQAEFTELVQLIWYFGCIFEYSSSQLLLVALNNVRLLQRLHRNDLSFLLLIKRWDDRCKFSLVCIKYTAEVCF